MAQSPRTRTLKANYAAEHRRRDRNPRRIEEVGRNFRASKAADYIEELLGGWPPLTQAQLDILAGLLAGPHGEILDASALLASGDQ